MAKVKICGLRREEDIKIVNQFLPDYIGFVFAKSKRQVSLEEAAKLKAKLDQHIKAVGVFVNEPLENILAYERAGVIDLIQLHGDESLEEIRKLKQQSRLPIIKAIRIKDESSLVQNQEIMQEDAIDYLLVDAYSNQQYGGLGKRFDWKMLREIPKPFFLAGGINVQNVKEALSYEPFAVDVSSGVETMGAKDELKVQVLIDEVRDYPLVKNPIWL